MSLVPTILTWIETQRNLDWLSRHPFKISNACREQRLYVIKIRSLVYLKSQDYPQIPRGTATMFHIDTVRLKETRIMLQFFNIGNGQIPPKFTRREHFLTLFHDWWRVIKSLVKWLTETNDYNAVNRENVRCSGQGESFTRNSFCSLNRQLLLVCIMSF